MRRLALLATWSAIGGLLVLPGSASAEGIISALSVSPSSVRDGASAQGTVTLIPDTTATTVLLFSSDPSVASTPPSVVAQPGQDTVTFTITTNAAAPPTIVQITAAIQSVARTANLSVNAATPVSRRASRRRRSLPIAAATPLCGWIASRSDEPPPLTHRGYRFVTNTPNEVDR